MFQPQPTPFAAECFSPYRVANDHSPESIFPDSSSSQSRSGSQPYFYSGSPSSLQSSSVAAGAGAGAGAVAVAAGAASSSSFGTPPIKMEQQQQQDASQQALTDDLAAQEAAARDYRPELEGPLVGEKTTSHAIAREYAKANQIYVEKTAALPQTYSHFRPIQGDGNCGWRAIGFAYFETLITAGDVGEIESEVARVTSLNAYLQRVGGFDPMLFEDMVDETITLLKDLAVLVSDPAGAAAHLMEKFNSRETSNAILYHLRLLASSWLKGNRDMFEPFIPQNVGGLEGYCASTLERPDVEIEAVGIMLLFNVLLKPLDCVLEIAYLDLSPGTEATVYRWPQEAQGQDAAAIGRMACLLFRPDHYDMLYRGSSTPPPMPPGLPVRVNQVSFSQAPEFAGTVPTMPGFSSIDYSELAVLMPGFSSPNGHQVSPLQSSLDASPIAAEPFGMAPPAPAQAPWPTSSEAPPPAPDFAEAPLPPTMGPTQPPPQPPPPAPQSLPSPASSSSPTSNYPIRFGKEVWELHSSTFPEPTFQTSMFKNSHFNRAHYNNPHFHPEEWAPEDDVPEKGGRKKPSKCRADL